MSCLKREIFPNNEDIPITLMCTIGKGILNKPVKTACGHTFCETCLHASLAKSPVCPQCQCPFSGSYTPNTDLQERINDLDVFCSHCEFATVEETKEVDHTTEISTNFCKWRGKFKALNCHLLEECNCQTLECKNPGCTFRGVRNVLTIHVPACVYRTVKCESCGRLDIQFLEKKAHDDICTEKAISCLLDCGLEMKRKEYNLHRRKECPNNYTNIHVKGFGNSVTEVDLGELFKPYGEIVHLKLVEVNTKNNKFPYCFVCYRTPEAAHSAQTTLNNTSWNKRIIYVAKAVTPRHIWSEYRKRYKDCCIYIRNLPQVITDEELAKAFADFGFVFATHIVTTQTEDPTVKVSKGTAYVCFALPSEADAAVTHCQHGPMFGGNIKVNKYVPQEERMDSRIPQQGFSGHMYQYPQYQAPSYMPMQNAYYYPTYYQSPMQPISKNVHYLYKGFI